MPCNFSYRKIIIWCEVKHARTLQLHFQTVFSLQAPPVHIGQFIPLGKQYSKLQVSEMVLHNKFLQDTTAIHVTGIYPDALSTNSSLYRATLNAIVEKNTLLFTSIDEGLDQKNPGRWLFTTRHYDDAITYLEEVFMPQYQSYLKTTKIPIDQHLLYSEPRVLYHKVPQMSTEEPKNSYSKILLQRRLENNWEYDEDSLINEAQGVTNHPRNTAWRSPPKIVWTPVSQQPKKKSHSPSTTLQTDLSTQPPSPPDQNQTPFQLNHEEQLRDALHKLNTQHEQRLSEYDDKFNKLHKQILELTNRLATQETVSRNALQQQENQNKAWKHAIEAKLDQTIHTYEEKMDANHEMIDKRLKHQNIKFENLEKCILKLTHAFNDLQTSMVPLQPPPPNIQRTAFTVDRIRNARSDKNLVTNENPHQTPTKSPPPKRTRQAIAETPPKPPPDPNSNRFAAFMEAEASSPENSPDDSPMATSLDPDECSEATSTLSQNE